MSANEVATLLKPLRTKLILKYAYLAWVERAKYVHVFVQFYLEHNHSLHCRLGLKKLNTTVGHYVERVAPAC